MFLKEIKQKINSTKRISQVTGALELISAVKMRKSQKIALQSRPFSKKVIEILKRLSEYQEGYLEKNSFYFREKKVEKILSVVVSSDKGFCSSFNKNILKFADRDILEMQKTAEVEIMPVGKKAVNFFKKRNFGAQEKSQAKLKAEFMGIGDYGEFEEVRPIADLLLRYFQEAQFQKIYLFYTDFISSFLQKPRKIQILPLSPEIFQEMLAEKAGEIKLKEKDSDVSVFSGGLDYIFEPSQEKIFETLVPQLVEFEIYHAVLEANASEHSARMMAMRNACQNAKDIIDDLTLNYNKVRQNQITSEVSEISSAKQALA